MAREAPRVPANCGFTQAMQSRSCSYPLVLNEGMSYSGMGVEVLNGLTCTTEQKCALGWGVMPREFKKVCIHTVVRVGNQLKNLCLQRLLKLVVQHL